MSKYKIGLLIGRFQPFHKGHLYLINHALKTADKLIIGIGSTNIKNNNNPLTYEERKTIIEMVAANEGIKNRIIGIVPIEDYPNDNFWLKKTLEKTGKIDVIIGNNEWVNGIFEKAGFPILRIGYYKRYLYEGEKIRDLMKNNKPWTIRLPKYLQKITNEFFHLTRKNV